jgi:predicted dienelactone hydrolase
MQLPIPKKRQSSFFPSLLCGLGLVLGTIVTSPAVMAAQKVTIKFGPFRQTVNIGDLEKFAKTGKLSPQLQVFTPLLTPQVRDALNQKVKVNPGFADNFINEFAKTPQGKQVISSLGVVIPGSTPESLQATLNLTVRQVNGLTVLGFLRAYPGENITVDATQAASLAMDLNPANLESQAVGVLLKEDLGEKNSIILPNFNPADAGKEAVEQQTLTFKDQKRQRTIQTDIYSSQNPSSNPLVIISHGFGANRLFLDYLGKHLASYGVTVVAIEHPGSNGVAINTAVRNSTDLSKLLPADEFINRPQDVSFLLNELSKLNSQPGKLQGKLNTENVSIIGHSLGGYTALALVGGEVDISSVRDFCKKSLSITAAPGDWLQCSAANLPKKKMQLQDKRIKSAIALNPLVGKLFGNQGLTKVSQPVLIFTGTEDALTPALKHQITPFSQLRGTKYLVTAVGGTHLSISDPNYPLSETATLIREKRGAETIALRQLVRGISLAFIKQQTPEAKTYQPFLSSTYTRSLSTTEIPLRLVSELSTTLKSVVEYTNDSK